VPFGVGKVAGSDELAMSPGGWGAAREHDDHGDRGVRAAGTQHDHAGVGVTPAPRQLPCVGDRQDRDQTEGMAQAPDEDFVFSGPPARDAL